MRLSVTIGGNHFIYLVHRNLDLTTIITNVPAGENMASLATVEVDDLEGRPLHQKF